MGETIWKRATEILPKNLIDKNDAKYNPETIIKQSWGMCFLENPDFTDEKFDDILQKVTVTTEQIDRLKRSCNYVSTYIRTLNVYNRDDKRVYKRIKSRNHVVDVIYLANKVMDNTDEYHFGKMVDVFFRGKEVSINPDYNKACRAKSNHSNAIQTRKNALNKLIH